MGTHEARPVFIEVAVTHRVDLAQAQRSVQFRYPRLRDPARPKPARILVLGRAARGRAGAIRQPSLALSP
ncbi:MAG: hypothetical protein MZU84_02690 [Sphingobacterium sp.]|nr:hypothetical protein [Sphingobacterium sp.]